MYETARLTEEETVKYPLLVTFVNRMGGSLSARVNTAVCLKAEQGWRTPEVTSSTVFCDFFVEAGGAEEACGQVLLQVTQKMLLIFTWGRIGWGRTCYCRKHTGFFHLLCADLNSLLLCPLSLLLLLWDAVAAELGSAEMHIDVHF